MLNTGTHKQPAQPTTHCRNVEGARRVQATTAPAACERRALDGVAASCGAMKREVVKRLRQRSEHAWLRSESRGQFHRLLRSVRCQCDSDGAGLAGFIASAVTERSTEWCLSCQRCHPRMAWFISNGIAQNIKSTGQINTPQGGFASHTGVYKYGAHSNRIYEKFQPFYPLA